MRLQTLTPGHVVDSDPSDKQSGHQRKESRSELSSASSRIDCDRQHSIAMNKHSEGISSLKLGAGWECGEPGLWNKNRELSWQDVSTIEVRSAIVGSRIVVRTLLGETLSFWFYTKSRASELFDRIDDLHYRHRQQALLGQRMSLRELQDAFETYTTGTHIDSRLACDLLLSQGQVLKASDLHLDITPHGMSFRFHINGVFVQIAVCERETGLRLLNRFRVLAGLPTYVHGQAQEGRLNWRSPDGEIDARLTIFPTVRGDRATIRFFNSRFMTSDVENLGFDSPVIEKLRQAITLPSGLLLVTGPANSGKTTTLYTLLQMISESRGQNLGIHSVEDPVEYQLNGIIQTSLDRTHGLSYTDSLRNILRQDPGVLMVGEIRDLETAEAVIQFSMTGHLVLSTLHCGRPEEAIIRLLDMGVEPYKIGSSLRGVLSQRLVPVPCQCGGQPLCEECFGTGILRRRASGEWLSVSEEIRSALLARPSLDSLSVIAATHLVTDYRHYLTMEG